MGALTSLLGLSLNALTADQTALDATSNNVANQNVVGYTREAVSWQTQDAVTLGPGQSMGRGSTVTVSSVRDRVLEQRVQQQTQAEAQSSQVSTLMQQVQNVFGLSSSSTSASTTALGSATDGFFNALTALTGSPATGANRQAVLTAASTLASAFNSASQQLGQIASSVDQQVSSLASQVNALTTTIAGLNGKIGEQSPNADAGTLEDQRQTAIAQLSQLIGVNQITTEGNGLTLTTSSGAVLVSGMQSYGLTVAQVSGSTHVLAGPGGTDVTASLSGGQMGGALMVRDQMLPQYGHSLDVMAQAIASQVNAQNEAGTDATGAAGGPIFALPPGPSAAVISVATADPNAIATAAVGEGSAGSSNVQAMADLGSGAIVSGQTPSAYYAGMLGQIGSAAAGAATDSTAQQAVLTQLTTQRNAISGVSLDQEAANLTQYQRSYEAAAKVFSVVDQLLASALNLGEPTTVS